MRKAKKTKPTKVFLIEEMYRQLVISGELRWDPDKVRRMCREVNMDLEEVRALLRMKRNEFNLHILSKEKIGKQYSLLLMQIAATKGFCDVISPKTL